MPLSISDIVKGCKFRMKDYMQGDSWTLLEHAGEMTGEAGEAANVAKKIRRGWKTKKTKQGSKKRVPHSDKDISSLKDHLAEEIADTIIASIVLSIAADIDIESAIVDKFNEKTADWDLNCWLDKKNGFTDGDSKDDKNN